VPDCERICGNFAEAVRLLILSRGRIMKNSVSVSVEKSCHQFQVTGCLLARIIRKLKSAILVNDSVAINGLNPKIQ
jgi:hypothetical protein